VDWRDDHEKAPELGPINRGGVSIYSHGRPVLTRVHCGGIAAIANGKTQTKNLHPAEGSLGGGALRGPSSLKMWCYSDEFQFRKKIVLHPTWTQGGGSMHYYLYIQKLGHLDIFWWFKFHLSHVRDIGKPY
jgi:hypothetical protein